MLKYGDVNPLNVLGLRRVEHCPPHFTKINFDLRVNFKNITDWIFENLDGRFYAADAFFDSGEKLGMHKCIAFEIPGEASYFSLLLDKLNTHENIIS
jgi:hypothetical protein